MKRNGEWCKGHGVKDERGGPIRCAENVLRDEQLATGADAGPGVASSQ